MAKQQITTASGASPAGAYSQGIRAGGFVFVSGQGPLDPATGKVVGETIEEQTERTLENVKAILEAAGSSLDKLLKTSVFLSDLDDFQGMNEVYATKVGDRPPARSTFEVARLPSGALVEIEAVAHL